MAEIFRSVCASKQVFACYFDLSPFFRLSLSFAKSQDFVKDSQGGGVCVY